MKILMFGWEFPPHNSGGLGVACRGLARSLSENGAEVVFVLPKRLNVSGEKFKILFAGVPNIKTIAINSLLMGYTTSEKYSHLAKLYKNTNRLYGDGLLEEVYRYGILAAEIAEDENPDIIHAHDWLSFSAGIAAQRATGAPFIAHVHATEVDRTAGHVNPLIYNKEREGILAATKVISVSAHTRKILIDHYGISPDKVEVVHNGIESDAYHHANSQSDVLKNLKKRGYKIVIFVGRITIMKGPDYFLRAAKKVLEYHPKTIFVMAGAGDMEGQAMKLAAELKISEKVLFPGFLRGKELSDLYRSGDLFVLPSVSEPFGLVPLESLIHGTPVLVSKQSGVAEVLSHALKTDFWDIDDMADKILSCIHYKSLRDTLAFNGEIQAKGCTWDKAAKECLNIYNHL